MLLLLTLSTALADALPRDPFTPLPPQSVLGDGYAITPITADTPPLRRHYAEEFTLVGTLESEGERRALLRDPDGVEHEVGLGETVGRHWGKVLSIEADRVVVHEERWPLERCGPEPVAIILELPEEAP